MTGPVSVGGLPGLDGSRVSDWLVSQIPEVIPPLHFRLVSGGRSNLTFDAVDSDGRRLVLRRPPLGEVLQSAHDMSREYRIISALASTDVPVASPRAFCDDPSVTGAPFYVMDFVEGRIVRDRTEAERYLPEALRPVISDAVIDVLSILHALDPERVGLGSLGRRHGYVERQLRRWHQQWESAKSRDISMVDQVYRLLAANVPEQERVAIVHGDYRIDNLVLRPDGSIAAVLDWELCTLGDPLADLGMLMVYWLHPGDDSSHMLIGTPTTAPGFADRDSMLARYGARTGSDLARIPFFVAFALWKLAYIAEGMYARYRTGAMGEERLATVERIGSQVSLLAERALEVIRADRQ